MKRLEKIIQLTTNIYTLYQELLNMELQGLNGNSEYLEKLEILKLYKELEDKYYKELNHKYRPENIIKLQRILNVDDIAIHIISDLEFSDFTFEPINREVIVKRRIFSRLSKLIMQNMSNDEMFNYIQKELGRVDMKKQSFYIESKEIFVLNRAHILNDILDRAKESIYLRYIFFTQCDVIEKDFIDKKYIIPFINENIENKMLNQKFEINSNFIRFMKDTETSI